jgi:hypothetical protein
MSVWAQLFSRFRAWQCAAGDQLVSFWNALRANDATLTAGLIDDCHPTSISRFVCNFTVQDSGDNECLVTFPEATSKPLHRIALSASMIAPSARIQSQRIPA